MSAVSTGAAARSRSSEVRSAVRGDGDAGVILVLLASPPPAASSLPRVPLSLSRRASFGSKSSTEQPESLLRERQRAKRSPGLPPPPRRRREELTGREIESQARRGSGIVPAPVANPRGAPAAPGPVRTAPAVGSGAAPALRLPPSGGFLASAQQMSGRSRARLGSAGGSPCQRLQAQGADRSACLGGAARRRSHDTLPARPPARPPGEETCFALPRPVLVLWQCRHPARHTHLGVGPAPSLRAPPPGSGEDGAASSSERPRRPPRAALATGSSG